LAQFRKRNLDQELEGEILAHLELAESEAIAAGLSPEEARCEARRSFGGIAQMKEEHRDRRGVPWMENLIRDFRYGLAGLARDPGFAGIVVGLLALGIGANTAMFSVVDAVLLKPLPFPEPERMVRVWEAPTPARRNGTTTLTFLDWKQQTTIFEALSVESPTRAAVETDGSPARLSGKLVSADYFKVFGVKPRIGRTFAAKEDQPGAAPVVVISYSLWQSRFGGDPGILNRDLKLDGKPHKIIAVLPPGSFDRDEAVFWKPLIFAPEQLNRIQHMFQVVGRLRPGVSLGQAQAKMNLLRASLAGVLADYKDWGFAVDPFAQFLVHDRLRRSIYLVFGAVVMVLLIACANVANLMLAKGATRRKEIAVRAALGASRGRLIAQLLTESLVLCLLGGMAGVLVAYLLLHAITPLIAASLPFTADPRLDLRIFGFAAAAAMAVLILAGLLPSLKTSSKLSSSLNFAARGSSSSSAAVRRTIVIAEVALSVVLICGAALLFKSLAKLQQVDAGVRIDHLITTSTDLPPAAYPVPASAARFYDAVVQRLRSVPGVEQAAVTQVLPLEGLAWGEGMNLPGTAEFFNVGLKPVDPWYFGTMQIPVESGRGIEDRDRAGSPPVVVINQELARHLSSKVGVVNPVGRTVRITMPGYGSIPESVVNVQIVGVIRSERTGELQAPQRLVAYVPLAQVPQRDINLVVRTQIDPLALMSGIREAVRQVDANLALGDVRTMEQVKEQSMLWAKQPTWVLGAFAGIAALLAALGLYGVLAHAVTQQRREIGIRMALGAQQGDVLTYVLCGAISMLLVGFAAGLAGAFALTRVLKSLLFNVSALDPVALSVACMLMTLVGMLAAWVPASRAAGVDPTLALRDEG
jgi:putative ABC transport system permease protein